MSSSEFNTQNANFNTDDQQGGAHHELHTDTEGNNEVIESPPSSVRFDVSKQNTFPNLPETSTAQNTEKPIAFTSHSTVLKKDQLVMLKRCCNESCGCKKVHCPFCDVRQFKPTWCHKVQAHIDRTHTASGVWFEDYMIVNCHHKCRIDALDDNRFVRHFHCPLCDTTILKRVAFAQHLASHATSMGKDPKVVVIMPNMKKPTEVEFQGERIKVCTENCNQPSSERHIHCPYCEEGLSFAVRSLVAAHLWRCWERKYYVDGKGRIQLVTSNILSEYEESDDDRDRPPAKLLPQDTEDFDMPEPPADLKHPSEIKGLQYHPSIVRNLHDFPRPDNCVKEKCCGGKVHCPLCDISKFQPTYPGRVMRHAFSHWRRRLPFGKYSILVCYCGVLMDKNKQGSDEVKFHYHCPICGNTRRRRISFIHHLLTCGNSRNSLLAASPDLNVLYWSHVEEQKEKLKAIENLDGSFYHIKSDTFKNVNSACTTNDENMQEDINSSLAVDTVDDLESIDCDGWLVTEATDSVVDETTLSQKNEIPERKPPLQIYNSISAAISHEIIDALNKDGLVNKTLDSVSSENEVSWSWSPGTLRSVHTFSGSLQNLRKAQKELLKKIQETAEEDLVNRIKLDEDLNTAKVSSWRLENSTTESSCQTESLHIHRDHQYASSSQSKITKDVGVGTEISWNAETSLNFEVQEESPALPPEVFTQARSVNSKIKKHSLVDQKPTDVVKRYSTRGKILDFSALASGTPARKSKDKSGKVTSENKECKVMKETLIKLETPDDQNTGNMDVHCEQHVFDARELVAVLKKKDRIDSVQSSQLSNSLKTNINPVNTDTLARNHQQLSSHLTYLQINTVNNRDILKVIKPCHVPLHSLQTTAPIPSIASVEKEKQLKSLPNSKDCTYKIIAPIHNRNDESLKNMEELQKVKSAESERNACDVSVEVHLESDDDEFINDDPDKDYEMGEDDESDSTLSATESPEKKKQLKSLTKKSKHGRCKIIAPGSERKACDVSVEVHLESDDFTDDDQDKDYEVEVDDESDSTLSATEPPDKVQDFFKFHTFSVSDKIKFPAIVFEPVLKSKTTTIFQKNSYKRGPQNKKSVSTEYCSNSKKPKADDSQKLLESRKKRQAYQMTNCELCDYSSSEFSNVTHHLQKRHGIATPLRCDVCTRVFQHHTHLYFHLSAKHGPFLESSSGICDVCGKQYESMNKLTWHKSFFHGMHKKKNPLLKMYQRKDKAKLNEKKDTRKQCPHCGKKMNECNISTHIQAIHTKDKPGTCQLCGKFFSHKRYLRMHLKRHTGEKNHVCQVCGKKFLESNTLKDHIETHKSENEKRYRYICNVCGKKFLSKCNFKEHENIHTGSKPHVCGECGKGFGNKNTLEKHKIYIHTTERPFKCLHCEKSFKFKEKLSNHMVIHTGISKFTCTQCNKPLATQTNLNNHIKKCKGPKTLLNKVPKSRLGVHVYETNTSARPVPSATNTTDNILGETTYIVENQNTFHPILEQDNIPEEASAAENEVFMCSECQETFSSLDDAQNHVVMCQYQIQNQIPSENVVFTLELKGTDADTDKVGNEGEEGILGAESASNIDVVSFQGEALYTAVPTMMEESVQVDIEDTG